MFSKIKPLLITAVIAVVAVIIYNRWIGPKLKLPQA